MSSPISSSLRSLAFLAGIAVAVLIPSAALAQGSSDPAGAAPAMIDAGSGTSSASSAIVAPTPTPLPATLPDPAEHPDDFIAALKDAKTHGWPLVILYGAVGLLELAAFFGKKKSIAWLAWLGKGRVSVVIGGGIAILTAAIVALAKSGTWSAAFIAMGFAATTYWHQAGTDPAKG